MEVVAGCGTIAGENTTLCDLYQSLAAVLLPTTNSTFCLGSLWASSAEERLKSPILKTVVAGLAAGWAVSAAARVRAVSVVTKALLQEVRIMALLPICAADWGRGRVL